MSDFQTHADVPEIFRGLHFSPLEAKMGSKPNERMGQEFADVLPGRMCRSATQVTEILYDQRRQAWSLLELTHLDKGVTLEVLTWVEMVYSRPLVPGE